MQGEPEALLDMGGRGGGCLCVPSPRKNMRSQLQASEPQWVMGTMAEVGGGGGDASDLPSWLLGPSVEPGEPWKSDACVSNKTNTCPEEHERFMETATSGCCQSSFSTVGD